MTPVPADRAVVAALRIAVVGSCVGQAAQLLLYTGPVLSWLWMEHNWSESITLRLESAAAWFLLACVPFLFLRSARAALLGIVAWLSLSAFADTMITAWHPVLALAEHAASCAAPLALFALLRGGLPRSRRVVEWLLRGGASLTFLGHGISALLRNGQFLDFLIRAGEKVLGRHFAEPDAAIVLRAIGAIDLVVALLVLVPRRLTVVAAYMVFWGSVTAAARIVCMGVDNWPAFVIRLTNAATPLALLMLWRARAEPVPPREVGGINRVLWLVAGIAALLGVLLAPRGLGAQEGHRDGLYADTPLAGTTPAHWRIVWGRDPAHEATVSWSTAELPHESTVYYDVESRGGELVRYAHHAPARTGRYSDPGWPLCFNHAELVGLEAAHTYWLTMVSDGVASREFHFVTGPEGDVDFKLLYGGDSRSNRGSRRAMDRRMRTLFEAQPQILALAYGGDYVFRGYRLKEWSEWLTDFELTVTADGRLLPLLPGRGNHEARGPIYDEVFDTPGGANRNYYATWIGSQFLLLSLNSNICEAGDQADFVRATLEANRKVRWQLASYHEPAYPAVKEPSLVLQNWVPLFERYDLDIAFECDGHVLKRTCAIRDNRPDPTGVVYIGEGGLGATPRTPKGDRWYFRGGMTASTLHVQLLTVTRQSLTVEAITDKGEVVDHYVAQPRRR